MSEQASALPISLGIGSTTAARRRTLAILLMVLIATIFWVDSRYPALMKRYSAGTHVTAKGALTFSSVYQVDRSMPLATRVWRTTINWLDANRVGMTFSFLFGPAALTFLVTLPRRRTKSRWLNTVYGAVAGVPLGVCSNCIAPIARGLVASGMSTESVLATMFASPALNVVVLAMTFALFPASVAVLKLATVFFLIFVFAPAAAARQKTEAATLACLIEIPVQESWTEALVGTAQTFARSFWYVARFALPLMLLAAILGAFVVQLIPPQALVAQVTISGIILVALVAAFLPVPMAFDVAIAVYRHDARRSIAVCRDNPVHTGNHQRVFALDCGQVDFVGASRGGGVWDGRSAGHGVGTYRACNRVGALLREADFTGGYPLPLLLVNSRLSVDWRQGPASCRKTNELSVKILKTKTQLLERCRPSAVS